MTDRYTCCDERRRSILSSDSVKINNVDYPVKINGIDYLEVLDDPNLPKDTSRTVLLVHFFKSIAGTPLDPSIDKENAMKHLRIYGGERIKNITVVDLGMLPDKLTARLKLSSQGDLSFYSLAVVSDSDSSTDLEAPLSGFDPVLYKIEFRFRPECKETECGGDTPCPVEPLKELEIDYLSKDYASFRRLMLDRISLIKPQWKERNPADLGVALVELLAYVGDYLSYQQDVIATEAYIGTARRRISVRRHARLVDYFMHDGCNSRVWVQVKVKQDIIRTDKEPALPRFTRLSTKIDDQPDRLPKGSSLIGRANVVFETIYPMDALYNSQNEMEFYTWGKDECCLPKGATKATLKGDHSKDLKKGSMIIFKEILGPLSGEEVDADPAHRHAVRLIKDPIFSSDPIGDMLMGTGGRSVDVTEIEWGDEDALPFQLCISSILDSEHGGKKQDNISKALGNIVLADHGITVKPYGDKQLVVNEKPESLLKFLSDNGIDAECIESLGSVPKTMLRRFSEGKAVHCKKQEPYFIKPRFNPRLDNRSVSQVAGFLDFLFSWNDIPGNDNEKLIDFLAQKTSIGWAEGARIEKINGDKTIKVSTDKNSLLLKLNDNRTEVNLQIDDGRTDIYIAKLESNKLNIYSLSNVSASSLIRSKPEDALSSIRLFQVIYDESKKDCRCYEWHQVRDLISSRKDDRDFVVEVDDDGFAHIRFGDGKSGWAPDPGSEFFASYRVGSGISGNIGADSLAHIVSDDSRIEKVYNPLPARGGIEHEGLESVRMRAPMAFRTQERAVTPEDYAEIAGRYPGVQKAVATFHWTGSWTTIYVAVDLLGGREVNDSFRKAMINYLDKYRMAGHDIKVDGPIYVPLNLTLSVCVGSEYIRDHVKSALLQVFSNRVLQDGRLGVFHPDNFTFGQPVYISSIYEAALSVEGVESVDVAKLQRRDAMGSRAKEEGKLVLGRLEIARLDNDSNFPDRGMLTLDIRGGR